MPYIEEETIPSRQDVAHIITAKQMASREVQSPPTERIDYFLGELNKQMQGEITFLAQVDSKNEQISITNIVSSGNRTISQNEIRQLEDVPCKMAFKSNTCIFSNVQEKLQLEEGRDILKQKEIESYFATSINFGSDKYLLVTLSKKSVIDEPELIELFPNVSGIISVVLLHSIFEMRSQERKKGAFENALKLVFSLKNALAVRDIETEAHATRVGKTARKIAEEIGIDNNKELLKITLAGYLHDIGKLLVPMGIIKKEGTLSESEKKEMRYHPYYSKMILLLFPEIKDLIDYIYGHHERWDGTGYPKGDKAAKKNNPLGARILAIADVIVALTEERPYKNGFSKKKIIQILKEESGKHFDPELVEPAIRVLNKLGPSKKASYWEEMRKRLTHAQKRAKLIIE